MQSTADKIHLDEMRAEGEDFKKADLDVFAAGERFIADISNPDPLAESNLSDAAKEPLAVGDKRAAFKIKKYEEKYKRFGKFVPIVIESTGGMTKSCALALRDILKAAKHSGVWASRDVVRGLKQRLCVAVARGRANVILHALRHSEVD